MLEYLYTPQPDINYNFIKMSYVFAIFIGIVLFIGDHVFLVESLKGYYVIFIPFIPSLLWVLAISRNKVSELTKEKSE